MVNPRRFVGWGSGVGWGVGETAGVSDGAAVGAGVSVGAADGEAGAEAEGVPEAAGDSLVAGEGVPTGDGVIGKDGRGVTDSIGPGDSWVVQVYAAVVARPRNRYRTIRTPRTATPPMICVRYFSNGLCCTTRLRRARRSARDAGAVDCGRWRVEVEDSGVFGTDSPRTTRRDRFATAQGSPWTASGAEGRVGVGEGYVRRRFPA